MSKEASPNEFKSIIGKIYYDMDNNELFSYNGISWESLGKMDINEAESVYQKLTNASLERGTIKNDEQN